MKLFYLRKKLFGIKNLGSSRFQWGIAISNIFIFLLLLGGGATVFWLCEMPQMLGFIILDLKLMAKEILWIYIVSTLHILFFLLLVVSLWLKGMIGILSIDLFLLRGLKILCFIWVVSRLLAPDGLHAFFFSKQWKVLRGSICDLIFKIVQYPEEIWAIN